MATSKIRSFSSKKKEEKPKIPFEFDGEKFEAYGEVSGAVLLEFIASTDEGNTASVAAGLQNYLKASMDSQNWRRLQKILRDPEKDIEVSTIGELVSFLIEERSDDRPTEAS